MQIMESDEIEDSNDLVDTTDVGIDCQSAVNSLILDYYKKFGRKRDLEQYFSLSTAEGDLRDPSGLFWRKMKSENDSSGSEGKKSESAQEVCRISIRCSVPDLSSSQDENTHTKPDSDSPPIIIEEMAVDISRHTDEESIKSDDNHSQRSYDVMLDTSALKRLSPTSSITSQRKLEWDSLADVGYANESDRKASASSLSTLERLALMQQYSNNDTKQDIGAPTSHSTPLDENDKGKNTKGLAKKTTRFHNNDVDFVEVNVPHSSNNHTQSINVNLTKHISFNVEKDGAVTIDSIKKDVSVSPEKQPPQAFGTQQIRFDKEIQTSLTKTKDKSTTPVCSPKAVDLDSQKIPVMINLKTLRKRIRRKTSKSVRRRLRPKKKTSKDDSLPQEKSEQLSEAESFEYMPGHIYNQNLKSNEEKPANTSAGNKSSLESSAGVTDSSKGSRHSFTKDLEKSIELLKETLQKRYNDSDVKNKLVKEVVSRLLRSKYRDDDSAGEFLSGLTFSSRRIGLRDNHTTTSTSDTNNTEDSKSKIPSKSILRSDKFNPNVVASTSQSAPNLLSVASSEKTIPSNLIKVKRTTDSDVSSRKSSSDNAFPKTSSEELYLKYLEALRREEAYKKHLKDKEMFLKQRLVSSDTVFKVPVRQEAIINNRLKDLMKDLTRNNYDDGSGDASKLEGGSNSVDFERYNAGRNHRSHSVFTLSSSHSDCQDKKPNLKKKQCDVRDMNEAGPSKHYYCCPQHNTKSKIGYTDSSVQVNIKCQYEDAECTEKPKLRAVECQRYIESPQNMGHVISDDVGDIKFVCLCNEKPLAAPEMGDNFLLYKCSRLTNRGIQLEGTSSKISNTGVQCGGDSCGKKQEDIKLIRRPCKMTDNESSSSDNIPCVRKQSKSSQTNLLVKMIYEEPSGTMTCMSDGKTSKGDPSISTKCVVGSDCSSKNIVHEATRCLQTEISINPKISDPSLTDINLVNDCECAKLVNEKFREVSRTCSKKSDSGRNAKDCSDICASSISGKNSEKNLVFDDEIKCCDDINEFEQPSNLCVEMVRDDYQIPIHGTNMTLQVTLGSHEVKRNVEKVNQGCITEKACIVEQATSIREECSKAVQCECSHIATTNKTARTCLNEPNSNKVNKDTGTQSCGSRMEKPIQACLPEEPKCNTYPKHVQIKKPFLRSNTDTDAIEKSCCVQTDFSTKTNYEARRVTHVDQITSRPAKTYESDNECGRKCNMDKDIAKKSPRNERGTESCKKKDIGIQKDSPRQPEVKPRSSTKMSKCVGCETDTTIENEPYQTKDKPQTSCIKKKESPKCSSDLERAYTSVCCDDPKSSSLSKVQDKCCEEDTDVATIKDPIIEMIKDITKRYSKNDIEKMKRKTCFKEIMTVLNYLLETDEITDRGKPSCSSGTDTKSSCNAKKPQEKVSEEATKPIENPPQVTKTCKTIKVSTESSDIPASSDLPVTSSDSATCKVLNKIKKECEKYHQKRCKAGRKCEASSSTSVNCDQCKKVHHCVCRGHKCKRSKASAEKFQKKCVAYNLIIQTSESMISEEMTCNKKCKPLQNIVVKVPKRKPVENICKETSCKKETVYKVEKPRCSPRCSTKNRSRSCPNESEMSSTEELVRNTQQCTVREYLEKNRPDFVENCSQRQSCMKFVSDIRANERAAQRDVLSMHMAREPDLTTLSEGQLRRLAADIGIDLRRKKPAPKFMSEKAMKKHSEKIYKTLPEVVQKKEEKKKENIKKTNLLMAYIFKKNLQKKTLRGSVNLSNYSAVIKI